MKFIKYITLSLALTFSATSCSDSFLETELVGRVPAEEALKTALNQYPEQLIKSQNNNFGICFIISSKSTV